MNYAQAGKSYLLVSTQTATPGRLVLMLYDGAIGFLERARSGFQQEDPLQFNQTIHNNVRRAQDILAELNLSLNMEVGGQFSATMRRLYDYMNWRLAQSNLKKEPEGIEEVLRRLTVLRDAWAEMLRQQEFSAAAPSASLLESTRG